MKKCYICKREFEIKTAKNKGQIMKKNIKRRDSITCSKKCSTLNIRKKRINSQSTSNKKETTN